MTIRLKHWVKLPLSLAVASVMSGQAAGYSFNVGEVEASIDTTLSAGATWRVTDRELSLINQSNGDTVGAATPSGSTNNTDDGNLNFDKGDTVSKVVTGRTDLFLSYSPDSDTLTRVGAFLRGRYYYDFELKDERRAEPPVGERGVLNDRVKDNASGAEILDAYVFSDWWLGNVPVSVRYGNQVVSWGESTFIQGGINAINPINVNALRAPGSELKDALLPVEMLYVSAGISENVTVEAFVQTDWEKVRPDDCGTFFSTNDFASDGCGPVLLASSQPQEDILASGIVSPRLSDRDADSKDQFGVAVRFFVPELNNSEIGIYYTKYNSRLPLVSGIVGDVTLVDAFNARAGLIGTPDGNGGTISAQQVAGLALGAAAPSYFVEYPENINLYGISINTTTPGGWSLGAEYSFKEGVPLQWSAFELIYGGLSAGSSSIGGGVTGETLSLLQKQREAEAGVAQGALTGQDIDGYDRFDVSQAQFTLIKFFDQVMGASRLTVVNEVGATYVHGLPELDEARYGRSGTFGIGTIPLADGSDYCAGGALGNANTDYCSNDGYTSSFSWGYRTRFVWDYNNVFAGVNLSPQIAWSHDVKGYAPQPAGNFVEDRKALGLSVQAVYQNSITANIGYTNFFDGEPFNEQRDRDFVSASVSYSF